MVGSTYSLQELSKMSRSFPKTGTMPALFIGHGSPMNAIEENEFVTGFRKVSQDIPAPSAILCISAHWETNGTRVTAMPQPPTIHDFGGFPQELFEVQYPAPGDPGLAADIQGLVQTTDILLDHEWGLDHGAWSVIKHMYPDASVPVIQLSLDVNASPEKHLSLARELSVLRKRGVLIIGSGNMVHNLRLLDWRKLREDNYGFDWALEANQKMKQMILNRDMKSLSAFRDLGPSIQLAIPTPEHFLPLLYAMGVSVSSDEISFFNDKAFGGALTMTSVLMQ
ncbi:MAG: 4,5-DOPA dioxygenase extradiol [Taibaiella sp.]|nr:4,5-DOPA dioxygenase extradiol [Taibaiella sp.]